MATSADKVLHQVKFNHQSDKIVLTVMLDPATVRRSRPPTATANVAKMSILETVKKAFTQAHSTSAPMVPFAHLEIEACEPSFA